MNYDHWPVWLSHKYYFNFYCHYIAKEKITEKANNERQI